MNGPLSNWLYAYIKSQNQKDKNRKRGTRCKCVCQRAKRLTEDGKCQEAMELGWVRTKALSRQSELTHRQPQPSVRMDRGSPYRDKKRGGGGEKCDG